jgi:hypothetical protein
VDFGFGVFVLTANTTVPGVVPASVGPLDDGVLRFLLVAIPPGVVASDTLGLAGEGGSTGTGGFSCENQKTKHQQ